MRKLIERTGASLLSAALSLPHGWRLHFMSKSSLLISLDGLSLEDFHSLQSRLPKSAHHLNAGSTAVLDAGMLTAPSAIWGEILTGEPWYKNGCSGYSMPQRSLNSTKIVSEKDLKVPFKYLPQNTAQLIVNVPLVMPKEPHRTWLSDGSLPMPVVMSPSSLASVEPFSQYTPRRYSALESMYQSITNTLENLLDEEKTRLECARALMHRQEWSTCIVRLSLFDRLAHLIGIDYLTDLSLSYTGVVDYFLSLLDDWLESILAGGEPVSIVSAFSHTRCRARFNLNKLLRDGSFLDFQNSDLHSSHRVLAFAGATEIEEVESSSRPAEQIHHFHVRTRSCHQPTFDVSKTIAASPTQGCIWINWEDRFADGIVESVERTMIRQQLRDFLNRELASRFESFKLWSKDGLSDGEMSHCAATTDSAIVNPDFLVYLPETEVHNSFDSSFTKHDLPRCVHHPEGFLWSRSACLPEKVSASGVVNFA